MLKQIVEMLSPLSIIYKIISEFKSNAFFPKMLLIITMTTFLPLFFIREILVESGLSGLYFEKCVAESEQNSIYNDVIFLWIMV